MFHIFEISHTCCVRTDRSHKVRTDGMPVLDSKYNPGNKIIIAISLEIGVFCKKYHSYTDFCLKIFNLEVFFVHRTQALIIPFPNLSIFQNLFFSITNN